MESPRQVIIIEDDLDVTMLAQQVADDFAIDLIVCTDGANGLKAIQANPGVGVILDLELPDMDGRAILDAHPEARIVPFSGASGPGIVTKPQGPDALEAALELLLDVLAPVAVDPQHIMDQLRDAERLHGFLGRLAAEQATTLERLRSGDAETIINVAHNIAPTVGLVGFTGLAATLRRLEVATRDGLETGPIARAVAAAWPDLSGLRVPMLA